MEMVQKQDLAKTYSLTVVKSFLVWSFTLGVCLLVVGFPLVFLMATVGVLSAIILQSVLPASAVLLVASSIIGINLLLVIVGAAVLTLKGVHPQEVSWLHWLHGNGKIINNPIYAACPLTCGVIK
ncbi:MAG: hypothetical protein SAK42_04705 [Oscillatoria sp. PMC 1076.18]|nr:hypothetical protein [Oscillatoria sp. PMC 1076.18]